MFDEHPFEHDFFLRIAQSFPFIKKLTLHNYQPQENNHLEWPTIKYHHLIEVDLVKSHEHYVEEFLNDKKMDLSNVHLRASYDCLKKVTNNFTRNDTRINCSKVVGLTLSDDMINFDGNFKKYFPRVKIQ